MVNVTTGDVPCAVGSPGSNEFFCIVRVSRKAREDWTGAGVYKTDDWDGLLDIVSTNVCRHADACSGSSEVCGEEV